MDNTAIEANELIIRCGGAARFATYDAFRIMEFMKECLDPLIKRIERLEKEGDPI